MKKVFILLSIYIINYYTYAQTPISDKNWIVSFEDNFNENSINTNKWKLKFPWSHTESDIACFMTDGNNHIVSNGILSLMVKKEDKTGVVLKWTNGILSSYSKIFHYTRGEIISKETFKYGYFEIRCKLPVLEGSGYTGKGLGPAVMLWPTGYNGDSFRDPYAPSITDVRWSEIDIFEFDAENNLHTCNVHYEDIYYNNGGDGPYWSLRQSPYSYDFQVDFSTFHKFGCEWTPNYISFYIDDKLIRTTYTEFANDLIPMNFCTGIAIPNSGFGKNIVSNTKFPYEYQIDYIKVYKLVMDCSTDISQNSFNFLTFDNKVKRTITIGGGNSNCIVPLGESVSLRATQSIILNDGFEVPVGSEFIANICDCEN